MVLAPVEWSIMNNSTLILFLILRDIRHGIIQQLLKISLEKMDLVNQGVSFSADETKKIMEQFIDSVEVTQLHRGRARGAGIYLGHLYDC